MNEPVIDRPAALRESLALPEFGYAVSSAADLRACPGSKVAGAGARTGT
jgi:hypothetical protein